MEEIVGRTEVEVGVDGVLVGVADELGDRSQALKMKCERCAFVWRKRIGDLSGFVRPWRIVDIVTNSAPQQLAQCDFLRSAKGYAAMPVNEGRATAHLSLHEPRQEQDVRMTRTNLFKLTSRH